MVSEGVSTNKSLIESVLRQRSTYLDTKQKPYHFSWHPPETCANAQPHLVVLLLICQRGLPMMIRPHKYLGDSEGSQGSGSNMIELMKQLEGISTSKGTTNDDTSSQIPW